MEIAIIDIVFLGLIAVFALRCAVRGFVSELLSMAAVTLGLLSAIFFFRKAAVIIREKLIPVRTLPEIIAFVALFLIVFGAIKLLEKMLKEIIEGIKLDGSDRFLGFLFGLAEGILVVCLLLFLLTIQPFVDSKPILNGSFFAELLIPLIMGKKKEILDSVVLIMQFAGGAGV